MGTGLYIIFVGLLLIFNLFGAKVVKEHINTPYRWIKFLYLVPPIGLVLSIMILGYYAGLMLGELIKDILD